MKHLDHKFFIPFPEFFQDKDWDLEVYLGIDFEYQNVPTSVNIIFTRSTDLAEIKESARKDYEETKNMVKLPIDIKLAIQKAYEKLHNEEPSSPKFKLEFKEGEEGYNFDEKNGLLTIFVEDDKLPIPGKAFFYPADV